MKIWTEKGKRQERQRGKKRKKFGQKKGKRQERQRGKKEKNWAKNELQPLAGNTLNTLMLSSHYSMSSLLVLFSE